MDTKPKEEIRMRKRTFAPLPELLNRRWLTYTLAAGAGVLATSQSASAGIIFTPEDIFFTSGTVFIDFNHDGINDFKFTVFGQPGSVFQTLKVSGNGNAGAGVVGKLGSAAALASGVAIGPHDPFRATKSASLLMAEVFENSSTATSLRGKWGNAGDKFLGLRFDINGQAHYGWAEFDVVGFVNPIFGGAFLDATLLGYAFDTVPNQAIAAGKTTFSTTFSTTPEPGTLGLLALGSLGLAAWRRRKRDPLD